MRCGHAHALAHNAERTSTTGGDGPTGRGYVISFSGTMARVAVDLDRIVDVHLGLFTGSVRIGDTVLFSHGVIERILARKPHLTLIHGREDDAHG
jgi:hypothetical protein